MIRKLCFLLLTSLLLLSCLKENIYGEIQNNPTKLAIPPLLDTAKGKLLVRAQRGSYQVIPGVSSPSLGYNGPFQGPAILLHKGQQAQIEVVNELGEGTTLHSHGAILPGAADGGPSQIIAPGSSWSLDFPVKQPAATLWFHPHRMGYTAAQVWQGLLGLYIVSDPEIEGLPLPKDYGVDDIPLMIQERLLNKQNELVPYEEASSGHMATMNGASGNVLLVNGQLQPQLVAASGWLRLRLLNASNASSYRLSFRDPNKQKLSFYYIASEQGLLTAPRKRQFLDLSTASRAEIMLKLPKRADTIELMLGLWSRNLTAPSKARYPIMSIQVDPGRTAKGQLPEILHTVGEEEERTIQLQAMIKKVGLEASGLLKKDQRDFEFQMMTGGGGMMMGSQRYNINKQAFDMYDISFDVPKDHYEVWRFTTDMLGHPVHIHGVRFRILKSAWLPNGSPNWHDVFTISTEGEALVLLRFSEYAGSENPYMMHCHVLEHEEAGMMASFTVS